MSEPTIGAADPHQSASTSIDAALWLVAFMTFISSIAGTTAMILLTGSSLNLSTHNSFSAYEAMYLAGAGFAGFMALLPYSVLLYRSLAPVPAKKPVLPFLGLMTLSLIIASTGDNSWLTYLSLGVIWLSPVVAEFSLRLGKRYLMWFSAGGSLALSLTCAVVTVMRMVQSPG